MKDLKIETVSKLLVDFLIHQVSRSEMGSKPKLIWSVSEDTDAQCKRALNKKYGKSAN